MKLKQVLVLVFLTLTLIPITIVVLLLYKSGFQLSKESYTRNLAESMHIQVDYISQFLEENLVFDQRFTKRKLSELADVDNISALQRGALLTAMQAYLEVSEDQITACLVLDKSNAPLYTIGEKNVLSAVIAQVPELSLLTKQQILEFKLANGTYNLGIITPVRTADGEYVGTLISLYAESYIFKIISSYYKISNTATYICRENGTVISARTFLSGKPQQDLEQALKSQVLTTSGLIDIRTDAITLTGYYKSIPNTPWFLVGFMDEAKVYEFTNQFLLFYIAIILVVAVADVVLAFYFSQKVVAPINSLIAVMEQYKNNLGSCELVMDQNKGYFETQYLRTTFGNLMKSLLLVQHNFKGMYQLYQSKTMEDTNIDIDVKNQTISSNKEAFDTLMNTIEFVEGDCIVEKFTRCFSEQAHVDLMCMFENMRDEHLAVASETEVYTPHLNKKWFHVLVVPMYDGDRLSRLFVQLRDISMFKRLEMESIEQAQRDPLTDLRNRNGFATVVNKVLATSTEADVHGLLFIDMDYFKLVNDTFGHSTGDELLCSVSKTLVEVVGSQGIASRFGGDEFAVFLAHTNVEALANMAAELKRLLVYPYHTPGRAFEVSASIGTATWTYASADSLNAMLKQADMAMYAAKRALKENAAAQANAVA